jgi:hypothetical protein
VALPLDGSKTVKRVWQKGQHICSLIHTLQRQGRHVDWKLDDRTSASHNHNFLSTT